MKENPWQEPAIMHHETQFDMKEKLNEDIGEHIVRVKIVSHPKLAEAGASYGKY